MHFISEFTRAKSLWKEHLFHYFLFTFSTSALNLLLGKIQFSGLMPGNAGICRHNAAKLANPPKLNFAHFSIIFSRIFVNNVNNNEKSKFTDENFARKCHLFTFKIESWIFLNLKKCPTHMFIAKIPNFW